MVEVETGQELLECQSVPLEWMNWNQLISSFASSPHCITRMSLWLAEPRLCAWSLALLWWEKKLGEGVSRDICAFLAGKQCPWSVPPRLCPMVKRELPRKKIRTLLKRQNIGYSGKEKCLLQKHQNTLKEVKWIAQAHKTAKVSPLD